MPRCARASVAPSHLGSKFIAAPNLLGVVRVSAQTFDADRELVHLEFLLQVIRLGAHGLERGRVPVVERQPDRSSGLKDAPQQIRQPRRLTCAPQLAPQSDELLRCASSTATRGAEGDAVREGHHRQQHEERKAMR